MVTRTERLEFEGVVRDCHTSNKINVNFRHPYTSFRIRDDSTGTGFRTYFLTGQNKPPIQNGWYAEGTALRKEIGDGQVIFEVASMGLLDERDGEVLHTYEL